MFTSKLNLLISYLKLSIYFRSSESLNDAYDRQDKLLDELKEARDLANRNDMMYEEVKKRLLHMEQSRDRMERRAVEKEAYVSCRLITIIMCTFQNLFISSAFSHLAKPCVWSRALTMPIHKLKC